MFCIVLIPEYLIYSLRVQLLLLSKSILFVFIDFHLVVIRY